MEHKKLESLIETVRFVSLSSLFENKQVESAVLELIFNYVKHSGKDNKGLIEAEYIDDVLLYIERGGRRGFSINTEGCPYVYIADFRKNIIPYMMQNNIFVNLGK